MEIEKVRRVIVFAYLSIVFHLYLFLVLMAVLDQSVLERLNHPERFIHNDIEIENIVLQDETKPKEESIEEPPPVITEDTPPSEEVVKTPMIERDIVETYSAAERLPEKGKISDKPNLDSGIKSDKNLYNYLNLNPSEYLEIAEKISLEMDKTAKDKEESIRELVQSEDSEDIRLKEFQEMMEKIDRLGSQQAKNLAEERVQEEKKIAATKKRDDPMNRKGKTEDLNTPKKSERVGEEDQKKAKDFRTSFFDPDNEIGVYMDSEGEISLATVPTEYAPYFLALQKKVMEKWEAFFPIFQYYQGIIRTGDVVVEFWIDSEGNVVSPSVVKKFGYEVMDAASLNAIKYSKNFGTPPKELLEDGVIPIRFKFIYVAQ